MRALLPLLLLLACPLMMVFMMRGMHGHGAHPDSGSADSQKGMSSGELHSLRDRLEAQIVALDNRLDALESTEPATTLGLAASAASAPAEAAPIRTE